MALLIKDSQDLVTYLETRLKMIQDQKRTSPQPSWEAGAVYAFEESIKAAKALAERKEDGTPGV